MKFGISVLAGIGVLFVWASAVQADSEIERLDWLVGEWAFEDEQVGGDYRESGTRNCEYTLDDQYILCTSVGVSHNGHQREYLWYFNYNRMEKRYEMSALNSAWPRKDLYFLELSDDAKRIEIQTMTWKDNGLEAMNLSTVTYNGHDQYVWEIRSAAPDPETGANPVKFRDIVKRTSPGKDAEPPGA